MLRDAPAGGVATARRKKAGSGWKASKASLFRSGPTSGARSHVRSARRAWSEPILTRPRAAGSGHLARPAGPSDLRVRCDRMCSARRRGRGRDPTPRSISLAGSVARQARGAACPPLHKQQRAPRTCAGDRRMTPAGMGSSDSGGRVAQPVTAARPERAACQPESCRASSRPGRAAPMFAEQCWALSAVASFMVKIKLDPLAEGLRARRAGASQGRFPDAIGSRAVT